MTRFGNTVTALLVCLSASATQAAENSLTQGINFAKQQGYIDQDWELPAQDKPLEVLSAPSKFRDPKTTLTMESAVLASLELQLKNMSLATQVELLTGQRLSTPFNGAFEAMPLPLIIAQLEGQKAVQRELLATISPVNSLVDFKVFESYLFDITLSKGEQSCHAPDALFKMERGKVYSVVLECSADGEIIRTRYLTAIDLFYILRNTDGAVAKVHGIETLNYDMVRSSSTYFDANNVHVDLKVRMKPETF